MRANKYALIITSGFSILSLIFAAILNSLRIQDYSFIINVLIGIFASGLVAFIIAMTNYLSERRNTLERFASQIEKLMKAVRDYKTSDDFEQMLSVIKSLSMFDYLELDFAFGDMCFLFHNKKVHKYVYNGLYKPTLELRNAVNNCMYYYNNKRDISAAKKQIEVINELIIFNGKEITLENEEKTRITIPPHNKMYINLGREVYGKYRKIMYPFERADKEL